MRGRERNVCTGISEHIEMMARRLETIQERGGVIDAVERIYGEGTGGVRRREQRTLGS